jgi:hypothetical protein
MKRKKNNKTDAVRRNRRALKSRRHASPMKRKKVRNRANRSKRLTHPRKPHIRRPTTARQYYAMSPKDQETWDSVAHVISRMRNGVSLPKASKEFGIAPGTVVELGRPALRKSGGRYVATKTDRLLRVIKILGITGKYEIATRDSREASLVGSHWAAVQRYLQTGDDSALLRFKGKKVTDAGRKRYLLLTDLKELDRLASAGVLSFESMYAGGAR